jgi:hypothetical protein
VDLGGALGFEFAVGVVGQLLPLDGPVTPLLDNFELELAACITTAVPSLLSKIGPSHTPFFSSRLSAFWGFHSPSRGSDPTIFILSPYKTSALTKNDN